MALNYKSLGQSNPAAATATTLYTVLASIKVIVSVVVANHVAGAGTYRIAIRPNGEALAMKHYIAYDKAIAGNDSLKHTGITMDADDVITVYSSSSTMSFNAFGVEIT